MSTLKMTSSPWGTVDRSERRGPSTGVLGISNDRMVNIHLNSNRRGSLDSATFILEQMQQFINELDAAYRSQRYVEGDTILNLTAQAARDMTTIDMLVQKFILPNERESWVKLAAPQLVAMLRKLYPTNTPRQLHRSYTPQ